MRRMPRSRYALTFVILVACALGGAGIAAVDPRARMPAAAMAVGCALLVVLYARAVATERWLVRHGELAQGTITYIRHMRTKSGSSMGYVLVRARYEVDGKTYTARAQRHVSDLGGHRQRGDSVPVVYDPARPARATVYVTT